MQVFISRAQIATFSLPYRQPSSFDVVGHLPVAVHLRSKRLSAVDAFGAAFFLHFNPNKLMYILLGIYFDKRIGRKGMFGLLNMSTLYNFPLNNFINRTFEIVIILWRCLIQTCKTSYMLLGSIMLIVLGKKFAVVKSSNLHYLPQGKRCKLSKAVLTSFLFQKDLF